MEFNGCRSCEQGLLFGELAKGMELTRQLKAHMGPDNSGEATGVLVEGILSSYEKALLLLNLGGSMEQSQRQSQQHVVPSTNMPGSPISVIGSPKSEELNPRFNAQQDAGDLSRKRKMMSSWTEQVRVSSDNGLEGPPDDGHSWRKYGQKEILGAKHPRSYYRCTYRNQQGCCAVKQVQRNDEDPSVFDITYKGMHTCTIAPRSKSAPTSPEKREWKNKQQNHPMMQQPPNVLLNFQRGLSVEIQNLENQKPEIPLSGRESGCENVTFTPSMLNDNNFFSSVPPSFIPSPANSASNYFSRSTCNFSTYGFQHGRHSDTEFTEAISAATSGTNSPIIGIDFPLEQLGLDPSFSYDNQAFFPNFYQPKE